ncbi:MAG: hypothetical protein OEZ22_15025, partial [Spirochaetia bacterium]|nr:hypothetical protein [Spirochaetia bacterium]
MKKSNESNLSEEQTNGKINFINRISIGKKSLLNTAILLVPLLIVTYVMITSMQEIGTDFAKKELLGSKYIKSVRGLFEHVPQYRGMTNLYLNGDMSVKGKLEEKKKQIENAVLVIDETDKELGEKLNVSNEWQSLKKDLLKGVEIKENIQAKTRFNELSGLVEDTYEFIDVIANNSNLTLDPEIETFYLMDLFTQKGPHIIEFMGQARGLGSAILER